MNITMMREVIKMKLLQKIFGKKIVNNNIPTREKTVNVLVMGKAAVGKTSLILKLVGTESFSDEHNPTLYDDLIKEVNVDEYKVSFKFMELGGSQAFPTMQEIFIQQADMYILVYSTDDTDSYSTLLALREKIVKVKDKCYSELPIIVVRNKVDKHRRRSRHDKSHKKSVANWCYLNHDVSAKTSLRVNSIMENLIEESKFIGNEQDENNIHISGRYVYSEKNDGQSELYHKAPGMFNNPDNSDEKMKERRIKSQNRLSVRRNVSTSMVSLKRSLSLTSLRRSMRRLRKKREDSHESLSTSNLDIKQSTRSLNIRSSTLPGKQKQYAKSEMNLRSSTLPSASSTTNLGTPNPTTKQDLRKSLYKNNNQTPSEQNISRREKSKSMYIPRNTNSLAVPSQRSPTNYGGSCSDINSSRATAPDMASKFDRINRSTASINRTVVVHEKEKLRPKLSRQFSTDQGSMRDLSDYVKSSPSINRIQRSSLLVSGESESPRSRTSSPNIRTRKANTISTVEPLDNKNLVQQSSEDSSQGKQKNSLDSLDINNKNTSFTGSSNRLNVTTHNLNNIRASNSPQVLRTIPVMRRKSMSQNDINDMFTVNLPEPKRKPSLFKTCKPNKKSSPTNSLIDRQKSNSTERKNSGSTCSDKSFRRDSSVRSNGDTKSNGDASAKSNGDTLSKSFRNSFRNSFSKSTRDSPIKSYGDNDYNNGDNEGKLLSVDSRSDQSEISISAKQPLRRVRSKSSSEVPTGEVKTGSFSSMRSQSTKRQSWNGSKSKSRPKSILKNSSGDGTPTKLKVPLNRMESLSHDDVSKVSLKTPTDFKQYLPNRSSVRIKSVVKKEELPIQQPKRWLQSVSFNRAVDEL